MAVAAYGLADPAADAAPTTVPAKATYRLARINIPSASKHRSAGYDGSSPSDLFIAIKRNGNPLGGRSEWVEGFDVEFSDSDGRNRFEIDGDGDATFTITLYDHDSMDPDDLIFSRAGLHAADFAAPVTEELTADDTPNRAVVIYFRKVD